MAHLRNRRLDRPVAERDRDELAAAIRDNQVVVIAGETRSGNRKLFV